MKTKFNIEESYQDYLRMVKLSEADMPEEQKIEMRRTFYGAIGQMFIFMTQDMTQLPDAVADASLDNIQNQLLAYWKKEASDVMARHMERE